MISNDSWITKASRNYGKTITFASWGSEEGTKIAMQSSSKRAYQKCIVISKMESSLIPEAERWYPDAKPSDLLVAPDCVDIHNENTLDGYLPVLTISYDWDSWIITRNDNYNVVTVDRVPLRFDKAEDAAKVAALISGITFSEELFLLEQLGLVVFNKLGKMFYGSDLPVKIDHLANGDEIGKARDFAQVTALGCAPLTYFRSERDIELVLNHIDCGQNSKDPATKADGEATIAKARKMFSERIKIPKRQPKVKTDKTPSKSHSKKPKKEILSSESVTKTDRAKEDFDVVAYLEEVRKPDDKKEETSVKEKIVKRRRPRKNGKELNCIQLTLDDLLKIAAEAKEKNGETVLETSVTTAEDTPEISPSVSAISKTSVYKFIEIFGGGNTMNNQGVSSTTQAFLDMLSEHKVLALAVETTGTQFGIDEVIAFKFRDINANKDVYTQLIKPKSVTAWPEAAAVNGITPEMVQGKPDFDAVKKGLQNAINYADLIVTFPGDFIAQFLEAEGIDFQGKLFDMQAVHADYFSDGTTHSFNEVWADIIPSKAKATPETFHVHPLECKTRNYAFLFKAMGIQLQKKENLSDLLEANGHKPSGGPGDMN